MIVFVHGVPETAAIWDKVRAAIDRDVGRARDARLRLRRGRTASAPPRTTTPTGWSARSGAIDEPVDLVGHDWGAGITYRVATAHGDAVRSWAADVGNIVHPDYVWHDFAKIWQTPGDGEAFFEAPGRAAAGRARRAATRRSASRPTTR